MAGAVVGGTAPSMTQLIVARAIQGLGAGALIPLAMAVIGDLIPPSDRGRWQGLTGAVFGLASILGPLTGGWIADNTDWRWVFLVSLPVGAARADRRARHAAHPSPPRSRRQHRLHRRRAARRGRLGVLLGTVRGGEQAPGGARRGDRAVRRRHRRARAPRLARAPHREPDRPRLALPAPHLQRRCRRLRSPSASACSARSCSSRCSCRACSATRPPTPASCSRR